MLRDPSPDRRPQGESGRGVMAERILSQRPGLRTLRQLPNRTFCMTRLDRLRLERLVDRLLGPWDRPGGPGMTLGLVLDNELAVHRTAGLASIELGRPIGSGTTFRIASVSKQFTCAAILLLADEGKLRIEDDIRDWLPELPDLRQRITLDHLMHNTSGIRDMLEIMRMGGVDLSHPVTHDDLMAGICRQRGLNFPPQTRYLYSNSNFLLLGRVIEQASGNRLRDFLDQRFFAPLGMNATRHVEHPAEAVPGLATGYVRGAVMAQRSGAWEKVPPPPGVIEPMMLPGIVWHRASHGFPLHGEGGLVSSVEDLALWHAYLGSSRGAALAEALCVPMDFINRHPNAYARGVSLRRYRGCTIVEHGGLWPGYKTALLRVPDRRIALVCITNDGSADPHAVAAKLLDSVIDELPDSPAAPATPARSELARYTGRWIDRDAAATADISLSHRGVLTVKQYGVPFEVRPTEDNRLGGPNSSTQFTFRLLPGDDALEVEQDAGIIAIYHRLAEGATLPDGLSGCYINDDTASRWTIDGSAVTIEGPLRLGACWEVAPIEGDVIRIVAPTTLYDAWLDVRVVRDADRHITGLTVNGGRARNLMFQRMT